MTGEDILKLDGELFARNKSPSEALCRAIVGRSYYGAYHLALAFFEELGLPRSSDHKIPSQWLAGSGEPSARKASRLFETLYAARRRADYDLNHPRAIAESRDLAFVKDQIEAATDIKLLLEACRQEPRRSHVRTGIENFRKADASRGK